MDKAGPLATAQTGQIGYVDGMPMLVSAEMPLTEADGKVGGGLRQLRQRRGRDVVQRGRLSTSHVQPLL